jgi:dienelactone hydrolase
LKLGARWMSEVGGLVDGVVLRAMHIRAERDVPASRYDQRQLLSEHTAFYAKLGDGLFPEPPTIAPAPSIERRGGLPGKGEIVDLAWASGYQPFWERARAAYNAWEPNRRACARLFRHARAPGERKRPLLVLVHGYGAGQFFIEERAFPVRWLYSLGLDVALFTLPFHALRGGSGAPIWPSVNPTRTNEGFGQAIYDLRSLLRWLDPPQRAVAGMSLGGYTTSLLATIEPLDFACALIPVASFPDLFWEHGEGRPERLRAEREGITLELLRAAMAVHTPLLRAPKVPPERMLVLAAAGDRIAPPEHASRLAKHFGCRQETFAGGHILQVGRRHAFGTLAEQLARLGLIAARPQ